MKSIIALILFLPFVGLFISNNAFGDDKKERRDFDVGSFQRIELDGPFKVFLRQNEECKLSIEAKSEVFDDLEVENINGFLHIDFDVEHRVFKSKSITVYIDINQLKEIEVDGAVDLKTENAINTENLKIDFDGAGEVELEVYADKIISDISGVGSFRIKGEVEYHKVDFSGVGSYHAMDLISDFTSVESSGVGSVNVYARKKFIASCNGVGSVHYYGDPEDVSIDATGIGSVKHKL